MRDKKDFDQVSMNAAKEQSVMSCYLILMWPRFHKIPHNIFTTEEVYIRESVKVFNPEGN